MRNRGITMKRDRCSLHITDIWHNLADSGVDDRFIFCMDRIEALFDGFQTRAADWETELHVKFENNGEYYGKKKL
jgi:hypothetical protein